MTPMPSLSLVYPSFISHRFSHTSGYLGILLMLATSENITKTDETRWIMGCLPPFSTGGSDIFQLYTVFLDGWTDWPEVQNSPSEHPSIAMIGSSFIVTGAEAWSEIPTPGCLHLTSWWLGVSWGFHGGTPSRHPPGLPLKNHPATGPEYPIFGNLHIWNHRAVWNWHKKRKEKKHIFSSIFKHVPDKTQLGHVCGKKNKSIFQFCHLEHPEIDRFYLDLC